MGLWKCHSCAKSQKGDGHKGFSLIDILQPCVSFNRVNTHEWYKERVFDLEKEGHDPYDFGDAMAKTQMWGELIPIGKFYQEEKPSFTDRVGALKKGPLVNSAYSPKELENVIYGLSRQ